MSLLNNIIQKIPKPFRNKYIVVLLIFAIWILFLDNYNLISQYKMNKKIKNLEDKKIFYEAEIKQDSIKLYNLKNIKEEQEKFAREKFLMKKEKEDVYIINKSDEK